jgi:hypothetical protein
MWLVKNGVPYDKVWDLEPHEMMAMTIVFSGFEGSQWDWRTMTWHTRK